MKRRSNLPRVAEACCVGAHVVLVLVHLEHPSAALAYATLAASSLILLVAAWWGEGELPWARGAAQGRGASRLDELEVRPDKHVLSRLAGLALNPHVRRNTLTCDSAVAPVPRSPRFPDPARARP
jgi:hypothetical protein